MKELALNDRPREKLLTHGPAALGDNELVALVLGSGRQHFDALAVANELLAAREGLHGLSRSSAGDLARAPGIGPAKAAQLLAAVELGRRTLTHAPRTRVQLLKPRDTVAYLMPAFGGASRDATVIAPGGPQRVEWRDAGVYLTGWAEVLCEGQWLLA